METEEKTHQQQAIEHQNFFYDTKNKALNERPHDIVIGVENSKCRTCGEKWPKVEKEYRKDEPFEVDPDKRKY